MGVSKYPLQLASKGSLSLRSGTTPSYPFDFDTKIRFILQKTKKAVLILLPSAKLINGQKKGKDKFFPSLPIVLNRISRRKKKTQITPNPTRFYKLFKRCGISTILLYLFPGFLVWYPTGPNGFSAVGSVFVEVQGISVNTEIPPSVQGNSAEVFPFAIAAVAIAAAATA